MYLMISPSTPDRPEVLPELLTTELVIQAVERASGLRADADGSSSAAPTFPLLTRSPEEMNRMKRVLTALALTAALGVALPALAADSAEVGKPAPAFTLKDEAGKEHSLAQYQGKIVVLEWTNPELPLRPAPLQGQHHGQHPEGLRCQQGGVAGGGLHRRATRGQVRGLEEGEGLHLPVLQDPEGTVGKAYGAKTTPHMYVIDEKGVLRYVGAIDDDPRGKTEKPDNHVKTAVDALLTGKPVPAATTEPYGCSVKYKS